MDASLIRLPIQRSNNFLEADDFRNVSVRLYLNALLAITVPRNAVIARITPQRDEATTASGRACSIMWQPLPCDPAPSHENVAMKADSTCFIVPHESG